MDSIETEAPVAIGTGYQIAIGFMLGGGNAEGAVRAAAEFDPFTKLGGNYGLQSTAMIAINYINNLEDMQCKLQSPGCCGTRTPTVMI